MDRSEEQIACDVLVVGGGINGAAIARDAAGRGLRVLLCEQDDLGQHTSSASSKLIHGGLRYLEQYAFGLVRKALAEREILLRSAPHIMQPLVFVMPHGAQGRPAWLIRAGLFLYDRLAKREFLPASQAIDLRTHAAGRALQPQFTRAFSYADGWVDDARLVVLNAVDAAERGARIFTHTRCEAVTRTATHWQARLAGPGRALQVQARCLVNAAGPWAARFAARAQGDSGAAAATPALRLVQGSHIVVPRLFEHGNAYIFQHPDGRIVFALPYEDAFTLVGTTDVPFQGDPGKVAISAAEIAYLCQLVNRYFTRTIGPADVLWSFSGVRALLGDEAGKAAAASRDYRLDENRDGAPLLSILGGKITTSRKLAEQAVDSIGAALGRPAPPWTAQACLPGGDLFGPVPDQRAVLEFDAWRARQGARYPWLPPALLARLARAYGTRLHRLLGQARCLDDLGPQVVRGLYALEIVYLIEHEWARSSADILWRRTKLGLHLGPASAAVLDAWIGARQAAPAL